MTVTEREPAEPSASETTSPASQTKYLIELDPLVSTQGVDTSTAEINGRGFARSVTLTADTASPANSAEYNIGRHWGKFSATVGLRDDSPTGGRLTFEVSVDGKREYRKEISLGKSENIYLDVRKALRLKLTLTYAGQDSGNVYYGSWGDARLE